MIKTIYEMYCDLCGCSDKIPENKNIKTISITTDSYTDGAGDTNEHEWSFELCPKCMRIVIESAFDYKSKLTLNALKEMIENHK